MSASLVTRRAGEPASASVLEPQHALYMAAAMVSRCASRPSPLRPCLSVETRKYATWRFAFSIIRNAQLVQPLFRLSDWPSDHCRLASLERSGGACCYSTGASSPSWAVRLSQAQKPK